jgi:hypothetical protein
MLLSLLLPFSPLNINLAMAQDEEDFGEGEEGGSSGNRRRSSSLSEGTVREIQRGFFAKANVGGLGYVGLFGLSTEAGIMVNLGIGQDFIDQEKLSMSWELSLSQGINSGADYFTQASAGCLVGAPCTQGDLRSYNIGAAYEVSFYPVRRVGIGLRLNGGILLSPLLIDETAWVEEVLPEYGGVDFGYHGAIHPIFGGGPTVEYYTKLAHFSVGLDTAFFYGINWGMGWEASGFLKYTFGKKDKRESSDSGEE